jgi:hypothetical protein
MFTRAPQAGILLENCKLFHVVEHSVKNSLQQPRNAGSSWCSITTPSQLGFLYSPPNPFFRRVVGCKIQFQEETHEVWQALGLTCVVLLAGLRTMSAQIWTPLTNQPTFAASTALLLTDGTVMVHDAGAQDWWKLTPDASGSDINGTWSQLASLPAGYSPLYYASGVLKDGRVIVMGGEYNFFNPVWTTLGAIYNPLTNRWKSMGHPGAGPQSETRRA